MTDFVLRVAVPCPLYGSFDYLPPAGLDQEPPPGVRVRVPFGRRRLIGVLLETARHSTLPRERLKRAEAVLDREALLDESLMQLGRWTAAYYQHPIGEVFQLMLPVLLRQDRAAEAPGERRWRLTRDGQETDPALLARAPRQREALEALRRAPGGLSAAELPPALAAALPRLREKGLAEARLTAPAPPPAGVEDGGTPELNPEQAAAVQAVGRQAGNFHAFLLDGVTGSGKTEVYLACIEETLAAGRQALVLVPEIGLTPQTLARFRARLRVPLAVLHSGLGDGERLRAWLAARSGAARVVIGTRSAVWTPLPDPGLIIVDEEHDGSYKQQEGCRYSARDLAVLRAQHAGCPVVLGSATPSLESLHNVRLRRYSRLPLPARAGAARPPALRLLDVRSRPMRDGLSDLLLDAVNRHLEADGQVLLFLNRRGYAPVLLCHACGWHADCRRCDAHLTLHRGRGRLLCHHCGAEAGIPGQCPACGSLDLQGLGKGTERLEAALAERFPGAGVARLDRDSTARRGSLDRVLADFAAGRQRILIGTQMLAKGHDFPGITLAAIVDADAGLFGADFRAAERLAQTVIQVAGRAGRAERPGEVLIQTHHPEHPLLRTLVREGYAACAEELLAERRAGGLPPFASLALLRAEAARREAVDAFLHAARAGAAARNDAPALLGPAPAPLARKAGRHRGQLLLQATQRSRLQAFLSGWVPELAALPEARRVRWSLDVDPVDMA